MASDIDALRFWRRVDELNRGTLKTLCESTGMDYKRAMHNRTDCRIPKAEDLLAIARGLDISIEYLLTGEDDRPRLSAMALAVAKAYDKAIDLDRYSVERILGVAPQGKNTAVSS